jgi:stringent starvation protein B
MTDNNETPLIVVDASHPDVIAPGEYADKGKLILNVSYSATSELHMGNDTVTFSARFNGRPMNLYVPVDAIMAIYGRESGEGMVLAIAENDLSAISDTARSGADRPDAEKSDTRPGSSKPKTPGKSSPPKLTVIK